MKKFLMVATLLLSLLGLSHLAQASTKECSSSKFETVAGTEGVTYLKFTEFNPIPLYRVCMYPFTDCFITFVRDWNSYGVIVQGTPAGYYDSPTAATLAVGGNAITVKVNDKGEGYVKQTFKFQGSGIKGQLKVSSKETKNFKGESLSIGTLEINKAKTPIYCK